MGLNIPIISTGIGLSPITFAGESFKEDEVLSKLRDAGIALEERRILKKEGANHLVGAFRKAWQGANNDNGFQTKGVQRKATLNAFADLFYKVAVDKTGYLDISDSTNSRNEKSCSISYISDGVPYVASIKASRIGTESPLLKIKIKPLTSGKNNEKEYPEEFRLGCDKSRKGNYPHLDISTVVEDKGARKHDLKSKWVEHVDLRNVWQDKRQMSNFINALFDRVINERVRLQEEAKPAAPLRGNIVATTYNPLIHFPHRDVADAEFLFA